MQTDIEQGVHISRMLYFDTASTYTDNTDFVKFVRVGVNVYMGPNKTTRQVGIKANF